MTEAERYEKTLYRPPTSTSQRSKKINPQKEWTQLIARAAAAAEPSSPFHGPLLTLASLGNVPRKETQFRNFSQNSLGNSIPGFGKNNLATKNRLIQDLWNHLIECRDRERKENLEANQENAIRENDTATPLLKKADQNESCPSNPSKDTMIGKPVTENKESNNSTFTTTKPEKSLSALPSAQKIRKVMIKILKKTRTLKFKSLRLQVCQKLKLDPSYQKRLKPMLRKEFDAEDSKIQMKGKVIQLIS
jgi:hypothetical protein